jgi:hypothetical protein
VSIVVEVVDSSNIEMLQGLDSRVACVAPRQLLARLLVQTACSHRGLSSVYADLLSFDGSEFHMRGQSFGSLHDGRGVDLGSDTAGAGAVAPSDAFFPLLLLVFSSSHRVASAGRSVVRGAAGQI